MSIWSYCGIVSQNVFVQINIFEKTKFNVKLTKWVTCDFVLYIDIFVWHNVLQWNTFNCSYHQFDHLTCNFYVIAIWENIPNKFGTRISIKLSSPASFWMCCSFHLCQIFSLTAQSKSVPWFNLSPSTMPLQYLQSKANNYVGNIFSQEVIRIVNRYS